MTKTNITFRISYSPHCRIVRGGLLDQLRSSPRRDPRPDGSPHHTLPRACQHFQFGHNKYAQS